MTITQTTIPKFATKILSSLAAILFLIPLIFPSLFAQLSFEIDDFSTNDMGFTYYQQYRSYQSSDVGDMNGDGIEDLVFGSSDNAYVIFGDGSREDKNIRSSSFGSDLDGIIGFRITGISNDTDDGIQLSFADLNGDGLDDLFIGLQAGGSSLSGVIHVIHGSNETFEPLFDVANLDGTNGFSIEGSSSFDRLGMSLTAGDYNADGIEDVAFLTDGGEKIIGIYGSSTESISDLFTQALSNEPDFEKVFIYARNASNIGYLCDDDNCVIDTGNINGDEFDDLVFADPSLQYNSGEHNVTGGIVSILYGSGTSSDIEIDLIGDFSVVTDSTRLKILSSGFDDALGYDLSIGDLNGDGMDEVIMGAPTTDYDGDNTSGEPFGILYVLPGASQRTHHHISTDTLVNLGGFSLVSDRSDFRSFEIGRSLGVGDINNDGFYEIIIGSGQSDGRGAGETYVVLGKSELETDEISLLNMTEDVGFTLYGERDRFENPSGIGGRLVNAGDFNNDGFDDLVVAGNIQGEAEYLYVIDNLEGVMVTNETLPHISSYTLQQNYPNPFNPSTQIQYSLPEATHVRVDVFNNLGQKVATLVDARQSAGQYTLRFEASGLSSGIYLYQITTPSFSQTKKMLLIK